MWPSPGNTADREVIDELLNEPVAGAPADAESDDDDDDGSDSQNGSGSKGLRCMGFGLRRRGYAG
nr:hypothetical protein [Mycobacterium riyadhense]